MKWQKIGRHGTSVDLCREYFKGKTFDLVVELGTRFGESTISLNSNSIIKRLVTIDPYLRYEDYKGDGGWNTATDETYERTKRLLSSFSNIEMVRAMSSDAVDIFEDNSIDFIFVDGNHTYQYILEDLELYYPKVKSGGTLCGDDYFMEAGAYGKKMVQEAVNEFAEKYSLELHTQGFHRGYAKNWTLIKPLDLSAKELGRGSCE